MTTSTGGPEAKAELRISVVVCTHDRAPKLAECLASLAAQTLDRSSFEIVVVDDCSSDATREVAKRYATRVIRNAHNLGPAVSRNIGSRATTAPIIAFTDDDCVPDHDWLRELVHAFGDPAVLAVGGKIVPLSTGRILLRYYEAFSPLTHNPNRSTRNSGLFAKFAAYVRTSFRLGALDSGEEDLLTIASANLAIRSSEFDALGGFDERFGVGGEDDDLCLRLARLRPEGRLRYVPDAVVAHDYDPSLRDALRRSRTYGRAAAIAYLKGDSRLPAIFPFPLLILLSFALAVLNLALLAIPFLLFVLLYPGWLRLAAKRRNAGYVAFAVLQAVFELQTMIGFVSHLTRERRLRPPSERDLMAT